MSVSPSTMQFKRDYKGSEADVVPITRALISVSDKDGIVELCTFLASKNVELLSTGGTA